MQKMSYAGILTRNLAKSESLRCNSYVMGFSQGPKKEGKIVTLYFEDGSSRSYTANELHDPIETLLRN